MRKIKSILFFSGVLFAIVLFWLLSLKAPMASVVASGWDNSARPAMMNRDCGTDGDMTYSCPDNLPLCCHVSYGRYKCCPSGKPWACPSNNKCYATEEEATIHCDGPLVACN